MFSILYKHRTVIFVTFVLTFTFVFPHVTKASYTFNNQTFSTYEEMQAYAAEYLVVWRELHGYTNTSTQTTTSNTVVSSSKLGITTKTTHDIDFDSATLVGTIDFKKSDRVKVWFDYGTSANALMLRSDTQTLYREDDWKQFDQKISGLQSRTTFYYRAGGVNEDGAVSYGPVRSFSTDIDTISDKALIKAQSWYPRGIEDNRAELVGSVNFRKAEYAYVWFEYGDDDDNLYQRTKKTLIYAKNGSSYTDTIRKLDSQTTYYYRMVAQDAQGGKSYGSIMNLRTSQDIIDEKPKVSISWSSEVTTGSAVVKGTVDMNDFRNGKVFFVYGEDRDKITEVDTKYDTFSAIREYGDDRQKVLVSSDLDSDKTYTLTLENLDQKTSYYYTIGVEYENEDDDTVLLMGFVYSFTTRAL